MDGEDFFSDSRFYCLQHEIFSVARAEHFYTVKFNLERDRKYPHVNCKLSTMQNKNNVKKNSGKFGKPKPKYQKSKAVLEDDEIKKIQESYQNIPKSSEIKTFYDFPLSRNTLRGLKENKFKIPTEIQKQAIGAALLGKDVLGAAQTGSGKTLGE